jgi:hypothetical protein
MTAKPTRMRGRTTVATLVAALSALVAPLSAAPAAGPVVIGPTHLEGTFELADCGSFKVLDQFALDFTMRLFFDQEGMLVRIERQVSGTDTFVNSETGKAITANVRHAVHIDPAVAMGATTGILFRLTVPGSGAVFLQVGRLVINRTGTVIDFQAGPSQFVEGDVAGLCEALP